MHALTTHQKRHFCGRQRSLQKAIIGENAENNCSNGYTYNTSIILKTQRTLWKKRQNDYKRQRDMMPPLRYYLLHMISSCIHVRPSQDGENIIRPYS